MPRSLQSLDIRARRKILARYVADEITLDDVETEYDVSADSLLEYMATETAYQIESRRPAPVHTLKDEMRVVFKKLTDNLLADFFVKLTLIFFLFRLCVDVPTIIGSHTTPLAALAIEKAGIALLVYLIGKVFFDVFTVVTDYEEFKYASTFIHRNFGYNVDFQNLTPYQRCLLNLVKRSVRMLVFGLLFLGILLQ